MNGLDLHSLKASIGRLLSLRTLLYLLETDMPAGCARPEFVKYQARNPAQWASLICCRR